MILGGAGIFILGLLLRLINLTILPIFVDEAIYIRWAQVMRAESTLRFLPLSDGKQPLFMWLVIPFLKLISDPLVAGRLTSVAAGMGTLVGIFALSYILFRSSRLSLLSSFLYAISPFSIFFDRMALADSLLSMFGVWTLFFGILTARFLRLDFAMITGLVLGAAWLTKSPALFFTILLPLTFLFSKWPKESRKRPLHLIKLSLLLLITYLLSLAIYNILRLGPNFHMISLRNQDYVFPFSHLWENLKDPFVFYLDRAIEWIRVMGPWPLLVVWLVSYLATWKRYKKEALILTAWFLVPILIQSEFAKVFTARYILFSLPYLFILAGSVLVSKNRGLRMLFATCYLLLVFLALSYDYRLLTDPEKANLPRSERSGYLEEWTAGQGIREVAMYINDQFPITNFQNRKIVVGTEGFFGTLPDGLQIYFDRNPNVIIKGVGITIDQIDPSLSESVAAGNKTYLVVNSSRFKIKDPENAGLTLVASYLKAERPDWTKEYVQNGPRDSLLFFELK